MRPVVVRVQLDELRRATVPNSRSALPRQILEFERVIGGSAGRDQIGAGGRDRRSRPLLVAGQDDGDVGAVERSGRLHRAKRGDDHDEPAFVVADAGPGGAVAPALEALERAVRLEHGVEMADQQHVAPRPLAGRDEMAGAAGCAHVGPADVEAERLQLGADQRPDLRDPGEVQSAAVHVHQPFEQRHMPVRLGLDRLRHPALLGAQLGGGGGGDGQSGQEENEAHGLHSLVHGPRVKPCALVGQRRRAMTDPRRPRTKDARLPDALDQTPGDAPPHQAEARGSEDAQLLAGASAPGATSKPRAPGRTND